MRLGAVRTRARSAGHARLILGRAPAITTPFTQIVMALALARFAVNGVHGEWGGTIFSDAGGPWTNVVPVALRYLCLTAIWLVPMLLLGAGVESGAAMSLGAMSGKLVALAVIYMLAVTLTPPLFLIVSVSATSFGEIFSPDHWKSLFGGRFGDLFAVYVVYTGTLGMVILLALPPVAIAFTMNLKVGLLVGGLGLCMVFGVSVNLLGRLSGFFACGDLGSFTPPAVPHLDPQMPASDPVQTAVPPAVPVSALDRPSFPSATAQTQIMPIPVPPAAAPTPPPAASDGLAHADLSSVVPDLAAGGSTESKAPPLLDGQQRVETALKRFPNDPQGALSALKILYESFAPHPSVMQALAICLYRAGQTEPAIELANRALPLCIERGHSHLAAGIFTEMKRELARLRLNREQLMLTAASLAQMDDLGGAAKAYSTVISREGGETRAVKGLLQVAERILHDRAHPEAAAKVYRYLLQNCKSSPLVEYMTEGLAEAERRMGRTAPAS